MIRRVRAVGLDAWFVPGAKVLHQIPANRLTMGYAARHAFDSARSRVADQVRTLRASGRSPYGYLASRSLGSILKLGGFAVTAVVCLITLRADGARRALVRTWRSCGYLYQIARSAVGML
jgi:hypothetical protein